MHKPGYNTLTCPLQTCHFDRPTGVEKPLYCAMPPWAHLPATRTYFAATPGIFGKEVQSVLWLLLRYKHSHNAGVSRRKARHKHLHHTLHQGVSPLPLVGRNDRFFQADKHDNYVAFGHGGAVAGYTAMLLINRRKGIGVIVFSNGGVDPGSLAEQSLEILSK